MTERKKKLRIIQISLLIVGALIIYFTYLNKNQKNLIDNETISTEVQEKIKNQLESDNNDGDVFYNIEYAGLDLAGNRYILKSKEASNQKDSREIVNMKFVEATFYFKDDTVLSVISDLGTYNNKTLDMSFDGNVKANYNNSELYAQKAKYSNSESFLTISDNVKIKDIRGTMFADKLLFDIKKKTLNIASFEDSKINANINIK